MTRERLTALAVGHALAEGRPLAGVLRALPDQSVAARLAEQGDLAVCLRSTRMRPDLVEVACAWPAGLLPVVRRLRDEPGALAVYAPLLQLGAWAAGVLGLQVGVMLLLALKIGPGLGDACAACGQLPETLSTLARVVVVLAGLVTLGVVWAARTGPWHAQLARARRAGIVLGLLDAAAPVDVCRRWAGELPLAVVDLARARRDALSGAAASRARFVAAARTVVLLGLTLVSAAILSEVYGTVARLPGSIG